MPRAALLSIHARVEGTDPTAWEHPSLIQIWGPRFNTYVVPAQDLAVFSLARLPDDARGRRVAEDTAQRLEAFLDGRRTTDREAGQALGVGNGIRYATATGTVVIRWEGARAPVIWTVANRRSTPSTLDSSSRAGTSTYSAQPRPRLSPSGQESARDRGVPHSTALNTSLMMVETPIGERWVLASDEEALRAAPAAPAPARLLPSGDAYWLLHGTDRDLLVPNATHRDELWTPRVWPGALLVGGEIAGTWRRANEQMTISAWRQLSAAERVAVESEAASLPLPSIGKVEVRWHDRDAARVVVGHIS